MEVFGDPKLPVPVRMDHIHFFLPDVLPMQAWYAKVFGGKPGQRERVAAPGIIDCDFFPGEINLSFGKRDMVPVPTKGRALDHIGFDVTDIDAFAKKLQGMGIQFEAPPRHQVRIRKTRVAFLTDPWGTYIEVTENLAPATK